MVMILVVFEFCCGIVFVGLDVYFNVVGGFWIIEFVVDLVVVVVLIFVCEDVVLFVDCVIFGEISFLGGLR